MKIWGGIGTCGYSLTLVKDVNRVEVIDHTLDVENGGGRAYVKYENGIKVDLDIQDNGRTLKIFITKKVGFKRKKNTISIKKMYEDNIGMYFVLPSHVSKKYDFALYNGEVMRLCNPYKKISKYVDSDNPFKKIVFNYYRWKPEISLFDF